MSDHDQNQPERSIPDFAKSLFEGLGVQVIEIDGGKIADSIKAQREKAGEDTEEEPTSEEVADAFLDAIRQAVFDDGKEILEKYERKFDALFDMLCEHPPNELDTLGQAVCIKHFHKLPKEELAIYLGIAVWRMYEGEYAKRQEAAASDA